MMDGVRFVFLDQGDITKKTKVHLLLGSILFETREVLFVLVCNWAALSRRKRLLIV